MVYRCKVKIFFTLTLFFLLISVLVKSAELAVVERFDQVHLRNGSTLKGTIVLAGPRGIVIVVDTAQTIEKFIALNKIRSYERHLSPDKQANKAEPLADKIQYFNIGSENGQLTIIAASDSPVRQKGISKKNKKKPRLKKNDKKNKRRRYSHYRLSPLLNPKRSLNRKSQEAKNKNSQEEIFVEEEDNKQTNNSNKEFEKLLQ